MKHLISALALVLSGALCTPAWAAHWDAVLLTDLGLYHFDPHAISDMGQ